MTRLPPSNAFHQHTRHIKIKTIYGIAINYPVKEKNIQHKLKKLTDARK
jgi:hypothetical protein